MIYFVRHGQTDCNLHKCKAGQSDVPLNNNGRQQAKLAAEKLKDINFDLCFCSPLSRAKETCKIILSYHKDLKPIYNNRLIERNYGKLEMQPATAFTFNRWKLDEGEKETVEFAMETIVDVCLRVKSFYDEIKKYKDKNILIISHSGVGRVSHAYFNGLPHNGEFSYKVPNAGVVTFDYKE